MLQTEYVTTFTAVASTLQSTTFRVYTTKIPYVQLFNGIWFWASSTWAFCFCYCFHSHSLEICSSLHVCVCVFWKQNQFEFNRPCGFPHLMEIMIIMISNVSQTTIEESSYTDRDKCSSMLTLCCDTLFIYFYFFWCICEWRWWWWWRRNIVYKKKKKNSNIFSQVFYWCVYFV